MSSSHNLAASATISASAENRILIWRNEVVAASSPSYSSSTPSAPSLTTTTTTTTTSSSSLPPSALAALSRGRRFWNKISARLSAAGRRSQHRRGSAASGDVADFITMPPRKDEPVARTAMYRIVPPALLVDAPGGLDEEEVVPGEASSHGGEGAARDRALVEKQERLQRAARLLNQGAS